MSSSYNVGADVEGQLNERAGRAAKEIRERGREAVEQAGREFNRASRGVRAGEHPEGTLTRSIEHFTSRVPSGAFLAVALGAIAISAGLRAFDRKEDANFVGEWVPTLLILGLYNKLVRVSGSE